MQREQDVPKLKDAMHYVIARAGTRPGFGATKLYKVLWFAETRMFTLHGQPIYAAEFIREKHGPVPRLAMPLRDELEDEGRIKVWQDRFYDRKVWRFKSLIPAPTDRFSAEELATLDYWIRHIDEDHTATSISDVSHDYGWAIAAMGERLPVFACLAERLRDPTPAELERARRRLGHPGS